MSGVVKQASLELEYKKHPDITPDDIKKLREWLKTQPHLPEKYITDFDLLLVYFCCDKSAEVSKQLLDLHYTVRTHFNNIFKNRDLNKATMSALNTVLSAPLPTFTLNGYKAMYTRLVHTDPKRFIFSDIARCYLMTVDLQQYEEGTWPGVVSIIDLDMVTMGHFAMIDIPTLKEFLYFAQEGLLLKLREVHFLNAPSFMERLLMLIRPFTKKSLMDLIIVHERGSDTFDKYVSKDSLPKECGGKYKDFLTLKDELIRRFEDNEEYFRQENLKRVDESKRPKETKIPQEVLGLQGSFKKLDID